MKVLTMQLNSVSVMDIVAYGGAAIGMIVTILEYGNGAVDFAGAFTMILLASEFFYSSAAARFFLPHCHERYVRKR